MTVDPRKYLYDILQAIQLIEEFTSGTEDFEEYISDQKTQSSVMHLLIMNHHLTIHKSSVHLFRIYP